MTFAFVARAYRLHGCDARSAQHRRTFGLIHVRDSRGADSLELHEVLREHKVQSPIQRNTKLFLEPGKFAQINCSPHPPGDEAGKVDSENIRDSSSPSNGSELTDSRKREWLKS